MDISVTLLALRESHALLMFQKAASPLYSLATKSGKLPEFRIVFRGRQVIKVRDLEGWQWC